MARVVQRLQILSDLIGDGGCELTQIRRRSTEYARADQTVCHEILRLLCLVEQFLDVGASVNMDWATAVAEVERHSRIDRRAKRRIEQTRVRRVKKPLQGLRTVFLLPVDAASGSKLGERTGVGRAYMTTTISRHV